MAVSRSPDGIHRSAPFTVAARGEFLDKPWITCDNSPFSRFFGNCYTEFEDVSENDLIFMATSADGGQTWPMQPNTADGRGWSPPVHVAGPMMLGWLASTSEGYMAGDYCATAVVPRTGAAFPLFAAAGPLTGTVLHENTYTAFLPVTGGSVTASAAPAHDQQVQARPATVGRTAF